MSWESILKNIFQDKIDKYNELVESITRLITTDIDFHESEDDPEELSKLLDDEIEMLEQVRDLLVMGLRD